MPGMPVSDAAVVSALQAIGSDSTAVAVTQRNGLYAYSTVGSPGITTLAANQKIYSNAFVPSGESITISGAYFRSGGIALGSDASMWLECDISGGVTYKPVIGSKRTFSADLPDGVGFPSFVFNFQGCRGGNWRLAINMGAVTGTESGATGFNVAITN